MLNIANELRKICKVPQPLHKIYQASKAAALRAGRAPDEPIEIPTPGIEVKKTPPTVDEFEMFLVVRLPGLVIALFRNLPAYRAVRGYRWCFFACVILVFRYCGVSCERFRCLREPGTHTRLPSFTRGFV